MGLGDPRNQGTGKRGTTFGKGLLLVGLAVGAIISLILADNVIEVVDAGEIVVKQGFWTGEITIWTNPGPKLQLFGKCTHYKKSSQFWFSSAKDQGAPLDQSIKMRFNDGGHANLSGSVRYTLPLDYESMKNLHVTFRSPEAIDQSLVRTVLEKSVYLTGQLMSSTQSYAAMRSELLHYVEDQAAHGVYKSSPRCELKQDPITKQDRTVCVVELARGEDGKILRVEEGSPLELYKVKLSNFSLNEPQYDEAVTKQIFDQQSAFAAVQTSAARAREAEQNAMTAEQKGKAEAAKAKWEQEVIKARAVTEAESKAAVAALEMKAAESKKQEQILLGEGEAARKKLVMVADGALEKKLDAWVKVNQAYASAFSSQRMVPDVVMGSGSGSSSNASQLVDLLTATTARQIGLSMQVPGSSSRLAPTPAKK
jgi:regulator of protease activity HflC (stomatin/prohibitin superfamily)